MKINKLLFFLLALISFNSCVEYVDNGTKPDGPEKPEEQKYTAEHSNPDEAKYVGDTFKFTAMLNSVDVTASTVFKVNGTTISGNSYTAVKVGSNSVIATMDNLTASFKFTVLEKDEEEPEPTGNRIEYDGDWKPVTNTFWVLYVDANGDILDYSVPTQGGGTVSCTKWILVSADISDPSKIQNASNSHWMEVFVPIDVTDPAKPLLVFPHDAQQIALDGGMVVFNGVANVYEATQNEYTFVSGTEAPNFGQNGTANYTAETELENSKTAELFWNGQYTLMSTVQAPKGKNKLTKVKLYNTSINSLKFAK